MTTKRPKTTPHVVLSPFAGHAVGDELQLTPAEAEAYGGADVAPADRVQVSPPERPGAPPSIAMLCGGCGVATDPIPVRGGGLPVVALQARLWERESSRPGPHGEIRRDLGSWHCGPCVRRLSGVGL